MPFDQADILTVSARRAGADLLVSWTTTAPAGSTYQVYVSGQLAWHGIGLSCLLPWPGGHNVAIDVGVVDASEATDDFSASLTPFPLDYATLDWLGGTFEADDIAGFRVFSSAVAGGAVDYGNVLADIPAYPGGILLDGWGMGGWNQGGWGRAASSYSWVSGSLTSGVWTFAVAPYDKAGNQDPSPRTVTKTILAPPRPPGADARGVRLTYTYDPSTHVATLHWLASPA